MITKIILHQSGLVMCTDKQGRQCPTLQGMYSDIIDKITKTIKLESVKWIYVSPTGEVELTYNEWCAHGMQEQSKPEVRQVDENVENQLRIFGAIPLPDK